MSENIKTLFHVHVLCQNYFNHRLNFYLHTLKKDLFILKICKFKCKCFFVTILKLGHNRSANSKRYSITVYGKWFIGLISLIKKLNYAICYCKALIRCASLRPLLRHHRRFRFALLYPAKLRVFLRSQRALARVKWSVINSNRCFTVTFSIGIYWYIKGAVSGHPYLSNDAFDTQTPVLYAPLKR